ncbi:MAG: hypothetical protein ACI8PZ_000062 [Myxococcota bacterium]|jgi:hypothetical protein
MPTGEAAQAPVVLSEHGLTLWAPGPVVPQDVHTARELLTAVGAYPVHVLPSADGWVVLVMHRWAELEDGQGPPH